MGSSVQGLNYIFFAWQGDLVNGHAYDYHENTRAGVRFYMPTTRACPGLAISALTAGWLHFYF